MSIPGDIRILGVDPGISGAAAIFCPRSIVKVPPRGIIRLPTESREMSTKTKVGKPRYQKTIDVDAFLAWVQYHQPTHAFVEQVWAMPPKVEVDEQGEEHQRGAGNTSSFNFGRAYGEVLAVIRCFGVRPHDVVAMRWQRMFGLHKLPKNTDKGEASRAIALQRHPSAHTFFDLKKDHNSAEALLIAEYGAWFIERLDSDDIVD